jgi:hypothetical protein
MCLYVWGVKFASFDELILFENYVNRFLFFLVQNKRQSTSQIETLLWLPNKVWETFCVCSISYYITPTVVGWCIAILRFFFTIIIIILIILPHIFVRSISLRCLDQTLWNLVGISYAMWSCAAKGWFFSKLLPLPWKQPKC